MKNLVVAIVAASISSGVTALAAQDISAPAASPFVPKSTAEPKLPYPSGPSSVALGTPGAQASSTGSIVLDPNGGITIRCGTQTAMSTLIKDAQNSPCAKSQNPEACFLNEERRRQEEEEKMKARAARIGNATFVSKNDVGGGGGSVVIPQGVPHSVQRATTAIRETLDSLVAEAVTEQGEYDRKMACLSKGAQPQNCD